MQGLRGVREPTGRLDLDGTRAQPQRQGRKARAFGEHVGVLIDRFFRGLGLGLFKEPLDPRHGRLDLPRLLAGIADEG